MKQLFVASQPHGIGNLKPKDISKKDLSTAVNRRLLVRRMNHDHLLPSRPTRAHSGRNPGDSTRRATFRKIVGIINLSCAMTILLWSLFSQDIMAGAMNMYDPCGAGGCLRPCTIDGRPGFRFLAGPCMPSPPGPRCGAIEPKYLIVSVIYVPPGTKDPGDISYVKYTQSSTTGTSLSVSRSFKEESKLSYKTMLGISLGPLGSVGSGGGIALSASRNEKDTSKADLKTTISISDQIRGPRVDGINYDEDLIFLFLNPRVDMCIGGNEIQWELGRSAAVPVILPLTVAQLKDPTRIPQNVAAFFTQLTPDDFQQILLKAHPCAAGSTCIDSSRYRFLTHAPYRPGGGSRRHGPRKRAVTQLVVTLWRVPTGWDILFLSILR